MCIFLDPSFKLAMFKNDYNTTASRKYCQNVVEEILVFSKPTTATTFISTATPSANVYLIASTSVWTRQPSEA